MSRCEIQRVGRGLQEKVYGSMVRGSERLRDGPVVARAGTPEECKQAVRERNLTVGAKARHLEDRQVYTIRDIDDRGLVYVVGMTGWISPFRLEVVPPSHSLQKGRKK